MRQLSELTEFNQALVYTFEGEKIEGLTIDQMTLGVYGQFSDILDGYLFAQEKILPVLKTMGLNGIDAALIVTFIKQIHKRFAHSLLAHQDCQQSGEFLDSLVVHWHHGNTMQQELAIYLLGLNPECKTEQQMLAYCAENYPSLAQNDVRLFTRLLKKMRDDSSRPIHPSYEKTMKVEGIAGTVVKTFNRLATAWHENQLTDEERKLVAKFVVFIRYPDRIAPSMMSLAEKMLDEWKSIDTTDLNAFSSFLARVYNDLITIHPFVNANKRTARCWINTMLRHSGYPDIILRPSEDIHTTTDQEASVQTLAKEIRAAIAAARSPASSNELLKKLFDVRLANFNTVQQILVLNPKFSINDMIQETLNKHPLIFQMPHEAPETQLLANQLMLPVAMEILTSLQNSAKVTSASTSSTSTQDNHLKPSFFSSEKPTENAIKLRLKEISGIDQWKVTAGGLTVWNQFDDKALAETVLNTIQEKQWCTATLRKRADNGLFVVKLDSIDYKKLFASDSSLTTGADHN